MAAGRGLVAVAYERRHGRHSRLHQAALAHLFTPATDIYSCPLAMTDGAARTLLASGTEVRDARLAEAARLSLRSIEHAAAWLREANARGQGFVEAGGR